MVELFFEEIRRALENGEQVKSLVLVTSICVIRINARDVTRNGRRYSHYSTACGDFQTRAELKSRVENASPKDE